MKVGVFGGCFNPIHNAHLAIAEGLVKKGYVDKVIFVPTDSSYDKKDLIPYEFRETMIKLAIENYDFLEVSNVGTLRNNRYTYQVLDKLAEDNLQDRFYFICGTDNLKELDTWKEYEYILDTYGIIVIRRDKDDLDKILKMYGAHKSGIIVSDIETGEISSTMIRELIKRGDLERTKPYLDEKIIQYIEGNGLYAKKGDNNS